MTVIVYVPHVLTHWELRPPLFPGARVAGIALFLAGLPLFVAFNLRFVREGEGTPAPIAPTRRLVVGGPFRYVRNAGYLAVLALVAAQGFFFGSGLVLAYAAALFVLFHGFVLLYEEPTLRRRFGGEYDAYCRQVPRWIPHFPRRPRPESKAP
ncbi:MAG: isoprenylcysteine carboxylmethyltransferase family protein [Deltaproteobacteria bacterium]|nr:isoprenylcysteine carboxylmethyltransferase family protein [Deltaproteobacteria bacterium]